jgi:hypothetical protein
MAAGLLVAVTSSTLAKADTKTEAAETFRAGLDQFKRKDFDAARAAFQRAFVLDPQPRYLWDLALAEVHSEHPVEALAHFRRFLALPTTTDDDRRKARKPMAEADAMVVHAVLDVSPGTVVQVDGQDVSLADQTIDLMPGHHTIAAVAGERTATAVVDGAAGQTLHPELRFEAPPAPAPPAQPVGRAAEIPKPTQERGVSAAPSRSSSARWITAGTIGGVGVVGLVVGGISFASAGGQNSTITVDGAQAGACPQPSTSPQCSSLRNAVDSKNRDENIGKGFLIGGGLLVVVAAVTAVVWPRSSDSREASQVAPVPLSGGMGVVWTGRFE